MRRASHGAGRMPGMSSALRPGRPPSNLSLAARGALILARLRAQERWPELRIRAHQDAALRRLVAHAAARVPYYRDLFRRLGLRPEDIRTREDLARIPILSRAHLREQPESLLS